MADPLTIVRTALLADAPVAAIVGTRVSPVTKDEATVLPAITLQNVSRVPVNSLRGHSNLDGSRVQVESWAADYDAARALADLARTALQTAGYLCVLEAPPDFEDQTKSHRIIQDFEIWH